MRPFQVKSALLATAANLPDADRLAAARLSGLHRSPALSARAMSAVHPALPAEDDPR
jgi:hypothetical protein